MEMKVKESVGEAKKLHEAGEKKQAEIGDKIAIMVKKDFDIAIRHRNSHYVGEHCVADILRNCKEQYYGNIDCGVKKAFGEIPVTNLTQLKVSALVAWIRDLMFGSGGTPFTIEPTPIPELSEDLISEVLGRVKEAIYLDNGQPLPSNFLELKELVRREKNIVKQMLEAEAKRASALMEKELSDQCVEAKYEEAILDFLQDFCIYPYAVIEGPTPELVTTYVWQGNKIKPKNEVVYTVKRISPFDFYWSPDSTNSQDGSYIIVKKRYSRKQLYQMTKQDSYLKENVKRALKYFEDTKINSNWLDENPEAAKTNHWDGHSALEVLKYYGSVKGEILKEYGIKGLDDSNYYECIIHTLGTYTLKVIINPNPNVNDRPVYVTSYEKTGAGIVGFGIAQKVRGVEKLFQACLRGMVKNMEYSSGPIGEVDISRLADSDEDIEFSGEIEPFMLNAVQPDITGRGTPAYKFYNFPTNVGALHAVCQWFMTLADIFTQIPASIHGQPVGTGANRTFRGMSMLYGNALKGVQSGITNIDKDIVTPFVTALYYLNLKFNPKAEIKGDAKVVARGVTGLMEKELQKNDSIETAQIVAQLAQTGQVQPATLEKAINNVLLALNLIDSDSLVEVKGQPSIEQGGQGQVDPMAQVANEPQAPQQPQPNDMLQEQ